MARKNLQELSDIELFSQLDSAKDDIFTLRMRQQTSGDDPGRSASSIRNTKRSVARLLTEIRRREINMADILAKKPKSERRIFKARKPEEIEASEDATPIDLADEAAVLDKPAKDKPAKDKPAKKTKKKAETADQPADQDDSAEDSTKDSTAEIDEAQIEAEIDDAQIDAQINEEAEEGTIAIVTDEAAAGKAKPAKPKPAKPKSASKAASKSASKKKPAKKKAAAKKSSAEEPTEADEPAEKKPAKKKAKK